MKWEVISKRLTILLFPVSIIYCQQSRGLFHKRARQCSYNLTLRGVRVTVVVVGKQWVLHKVMVCSFSLVYLSCNAHASYCHLWPFPLYNIFSPYLINGTIFVRSSWTHNACFEILNNFCLKHFSFWQELSEIWLKCTLVFMYITRYFVSVKKQKPV